MKYVVMDAEHNEKSKNKKKPTQPAAQDVRQAQVNRETCQRQQAHRVCQQRKKRQHDGR